MAMKCPGCGNKYERIGTHLYLSECEYPEFSEEQVEIINGLMLGDGWINHQSKAKNANPFFAVGMTNLEFLKWLDEKMQPHTNGVKNATGSKHSKKPYYKIRTIRTPRLKPYADWYSTGELQLKQVELTPLTLKMWYVSDGWLSYKKDMESPNLSIASRIATDRDSFFAKMFSTIGVEPQVSDDAISFNVPDTETLIKYMGSPPPGFDNKWPLRYRTAEEKAQHDSQQETL